MLKRLVNVFGTKGTFWILVSMVVGQHIFHFKYVY